MEIVFAGICCWIDSAPPNAGKTVVAPNVMAGGRHGEVLIPSHQAFIHAKRQAVNSDEWGHGWFGGDDNLYFWLTGDRLSFSPRPAVGTTDLKLLPHVRQRVHTDPICAGADEFRPGFCDEPTAGNVVAIADFPPDASLTAAPNQRGAVAVSVKMPCAPVRITATPLPGSQNVARSLVINDPEARVVIANVNIGDYITGIAAPEDDHKYLICGMFRPKATRTSSPAEPGSDRGMLAVAADVTDVARRHAEELDRITLLALQSAANRAMSNFLDTLAAGCSASQWP